MNRLADIDACKGFAIFLVVLGHVGSRSVPADAYLYEWLRSVIYLFHMPFFMFLSGFVFFMSLKPIASGTQWLEFSKQKFERLFPAYFLLACLVLVGKLFVQQFAHVDNPASGLMDLVDILLYPMQSVSAFVWYIYVLFWMMVVSALLLRVLSVPLLALLGASMVLLFVPRLQLLGLGQFTKLYFFFLLGCCAFQYKEHYYRLIQANWLLALVLMLGLILIWSFVWKWHWLWLPISLLSLIGLHGWLFRGAENRNIWLLLGAYSFVIYLFNTICIGVGKIGLLQIVPMQEYWYSAIYVPLLTLLGICVPIALKKYLFPYWPWLNRITS